MSKPHPTERPLTKRHREKFLEALALGWSVTHAAGLAGRSRSRFYALRSRDEAFADAWTEALDAGTEILEDEARRRAFEGWEEPIYQGGELVGHVRRYDSKLLMFLLSARRPAVYREAARLEVNTPAVFVLDSSFNRKDGIEAPQAKPPLALPSGEEPSE